MPKKAFEIVWLWPCNKRITFPPTTCSLLGLPFIVGWGAMAAPEISDMGGANTYFVFCVREERTYCQQRHCMPHSKRPSWQLAVDIWDDLEVTSNAWFFASRLSQYDGVYPYFFGNSSSSHQCSSFYCFEPRRHFYEGTCPYFWDSNLSCKENISPCAQMQFARFPQENESDRPRWSGFFRGEDYLYINHPIQKSL